MPLRVASLVRVIVEVAGVPYGTLIDEGLADMLKSPIVPRMNALETQFPIVWGTRT